MLFILQQIDPDPNILTEFVVVYLVDVEVGFYFKNKPAI